MPLIAGVALFVVPQPWAELRAKGLYAGSFWQFWTEDYFGFGQFGGLILPTWNHLWFVAYLWLYTSVLALLFCVPAETKQRAQQAFDRIFAGKRLLVLPVIVLAAARLLIFPTFPETHALTDDAYAHTVYAFAFFFGVGLAGSRSAWGAILGGWKPALYMALAGYFVIAILELTPGEPDDIVLGAARVARSLQAWGAIVALLAFAQLRLQVDKPARRYLTEAIFPYYIAHQTIIVMAGYWLAPLRLGAAVEFPILLTVTLAGCALTYELGRRVSWLRPFIGLKSRPAEGRAAPALVAAE